MELERSKTIDLSFGLIIIFCCLLLLIVNRADANSRIEIERVTQSIEQERRDYDTVASLIEQGYSDDEIYTKMNYKMLPFLVSDVRKTITQKGV